MGEFTAVDMEIAQQQIEKCIELDPENAEAHMQLGLIHSISGYENWTENREQTIKLSGEHLTRALQIAPDSAQVQAYYGEYLFTLRDYERALFHVDKTMNGRGLARSYSNDPGKRNQLWRNIEKLGFA